MLRPLVLLRPWLKQGHCLNLMKSTMPDVQLEITLVGAPTTNEVNIFYEPLTMFIEMWYQMFLWALFSSMFIHTIAAAICFAKLRKHVYGKFYPLLILLWGVLIPLTSGAVSSAAVAFVYVSAGYKMLSLYALLWGIGHTVIATCMGFTRILATL